MSELSQGILSEPQGEHKVAFVKKGPRLADISKEVGGRSNVIVTDNHSGGFTEFEGMTNLDNFLQQVKEVASSSGRESLAQEVSTLRENMVYIGDKELQEAVHAIAVDVGRLADSGTQVLFYVPKIGGDSQKFITLLILEELAKLYDYKSHRDKLVKLSDDPNALANKLLNSPNKSMVICADDFILGGTTMRNTVSPLLASLANAGIPEYKIAESVRSLAIAARINIPSEELPVPVYSFYGVEDYKDPGDPLFKSHGATLTGSHSSFDYFENDVRYYRNFLENRTMQEFSLPLPINIKRPYKPKNHNADGTAQDYLDSTIPIRWQRVTEKFGL